MTVNEVIMTIAKQEGISAREVVREMKMAIDEAWKEPTFFQMVIFPEGKPDLVTFIRRTMELL